MNVKSRIAIERTIVSLIVTGAIENGCKVSIDNGDDPAEIPVLGDYEEIMKEVMHTDAEQIRFHKDGKKVGMVFLVYGNDGWDAINDHTDNLITNRILTRAEAYAMSECE